MSPTSKGPRERRAGRSGPSQGVIPETLLGDWESSGERYRFNYDGNYSWVIKENYTIENDDVLHLTHENYARRAGTTGLAGTWRASFPGGEWLDMVLGPYAFYSFVWNDGVAGGGYFSANATQLFLVEQRATVSCSGNQIKFTSDNGVETGTFSINGNTLIITFPGNSVEYTKILF